MLKISYTKLNLVLALMVLAFSACSTKEYIPEPLNCPKLEIIDLPSRVNLKDTLVLGHTNVFNSDTNLSVIYTNIQDDNQYAIINGLVMPMEMLVEIIDYVAELRTKIELYNNKVIANE